MPLSEPAERELLHTRVIEMHGFRRTDGLFDIEARLTDTKTLPFTCEDRGSIRPGVPLHRMLARMTVNVDMVITEFEADTEFAPHAICPQAAPNFAALAGLTIGPGFLKAANARIGGVHGCTHIREMLGQMGTVAFQTMYQARTNRPEASERPPILGTCLAYATDSPVVRRSYPAFYTGDAARAG